MRKSLQRAVFTLVLFLSSWNSAAGILLSSSTDRSNPVPLAGATVSGTMYVFFEYPEPVTQVRFSVMESGPLVKVENSYPFDYVGTRPNGLARPYDSSVLPDGIHSIFVSATLASGEIISEEASFIVGESTPLPQSEVYSLSYSLSSDRSNAGPLEAASLDGDIYVFLSPETNVEQVRFFVDSSDPAGTPFRVENNAPYDVAGGSTTRARPFDASSLSAGPHFIYAEVIKDDGESEAVAASFTVGGAAGLTASEEIITLSSEPDQGVITASVNIGASDGALVGISEQHTAAWLQIDLGDLTTPQAVSLNADTTGLSPGTYVDEVEFSASGYQPLTVTVSLTIEGDVPGGDYALMYSLNSNRSDASQLEGVSVDGDIYVFVSPETNIDQVRFFIDSSDSSGTPFKVENNAPYDFAGGKVDRARPFDVSSLSPGSHFIYAEIVKDGGDTEAITANFFQGPALPALTASLTEIEVASEPDQGVIQLQDITIDTDSGASADFSISSDADWLTVDPAMGATPGPVSLSVNTDGLLQGDYTATVTAIASGHLNAIIDVSLLVTGVVGEAVADQVHLAWVEDPATSMTVVWRTLDSGAASTVQYREANQNEWQEAVGAPRVSGTSGVLHEVTLRNLTPSTRYEYRVRRDSAGSWSDIFSTLTGPSPGPANFEAIFVADTGLVGRLDGLATGTAQVIDEIAEINPLLVLLGGDLAYYNSDKRFGTHDQTIDAWFNQWQEVASRSPTMPTYGNHEVFLQEDVANWLARFPTPEGFDDRKSYSFTVGDVHFVSIFGPLDSSAMSTDIVNWIEQDIIAAKEQGAQWIIPFFHVAPFSDGINHPSNINYREQLGPLFEGLGVQVVLTAHDQSYERTYPLVDVPATNTPTSTKLYCYDSSDGVTWVKSGPGGKLSSKNDDFSEFATTPAPAWTAYRDNTMHHFSRLIVSAEGSIQLDSYGVVGDGTAPLIMDSFKYILGECPADLLFSPSVLTFVVQPDEQASETVTLDRSEGESTNIAVTVDQGWLDVSPALLASTPEDMLVSVDTAGLLPGSYLGMVNATDGEGVEARLQVALTERDLVVSSTPDRSTAVLLEGATLSGNIFVFTTPDNGVLRVSFFLDDPDMQSSPRKIENNAPYDLAGTTRADDPKPFDSTQLAPGEHTLTALIERVSGDSEVVHASFTVAN